MSEMHIDMSGIYPSRTGGEPLVCERCGRKLRPGDVFEAGGDGAAHAWPYTELPLTLLDRWHWLTSKRFRDGLRRDRELTAALIAEPCSQVPR